MSAVHIKRNNIKINENQYFKITIKYGFRLNYNKEIRASKKHIVHSNISEPLNAYKYRLS